MEVDTTMADVDMAARRQSRYTNFFESIDLIPHIEQVGLTAAGNSLEDDKQLPLGRRGFVFK